MTINIFWFRRDLRLHDNHGLYRALSAGKPVLPVFIFDTDITGKLKEDDSRIAFIHRQLTNIHNELKKQGSGLLVMKGRPVDVFRMLVDKFDVGDVFTNEDYEPYAVQRDKQVADVLAGQHKQLCSFTDHVVFKPGVVTKPDGTAYTVYTPFKNKWRALFAETEVTRYPLEKLTENFYRYPAEEMPTIEQTGFKKYTIELSTIPRYDLKISEKRYSVIAPDVAAQINTIRAYDKYRDYPEKDATSRFGVHLRFGTLSIRECVLVAKDNNDTWLDELIWREFFIQILALYPYVVNGAFKKQYDAIEWRDDQVALQLWMEGKTGYPLVDAGMRELLATGYMHNRVRMVTASFLVKHLLIDWRLGEAWFAENLLDYELASNNGNWQWAAGTGCDAAPYFRIFNPSAQQLRFDPQYAYVRRWVPEFGTALYPKPMIVHEFARKRCLEVYRKALSS